jgi:hypothetical protein
MLPIDMNPAVQIPEDARIRTPVEIKLKPGWQLDSSQRLFVSDRGEKFSPREELPKDSKIVYKTPSLAAVARRPNAKLSADERNLLRYLQVILPPDESPTKYIEPIRRWRCVAEASLPPKVSLPASIS